MPDKENDQEYEYVRVDALEEQPPYLFFINLLPVVAMRIGAINAQNFAQLKQRCCASPDKSVKWKRLIWPILMVFASAGLDISESCQSSEPGSRKRGITQRSIGPQKLSNCDKRVAAIEIVEQDAVAEAFDL